MKPLVLTVEEEAIVRRDMHILGHLQQRRLCAEIDALRRLPVIATCADCGHVNEDDEEPTCGHPKSAGAGDEIVSIYEAPMPDCPLRGAR